jgi:NAD(P)-dependent dehydrogenase (short-subunit alcohol dehydrogenase family)
MSQSGGGVILNVASDLSVISPDQRIYRIEGKDDLDQPVKPITYSIIKTGIIGITKYLSTYWSLNGVRVNALSPGGVYENQDTEFVAKLSHLIPLGRMANTDEYRSAIQFLCSDASSYMTGHNLIIDGGRSVW